ncbi:glycosyltransferase family 4 protein [Halosimplex salinum]|uniref:glycosyltransferase family 4 protein n=1 Tax=Halosimplex salinum TaxID=1710538 RepID=UPI000F4812AE|nr:glycosyltransferase family 4 protein [Halosimplex salinum]
MSGDSRSVLLVHHRDISSPFSATVPHYLARELSESHTVHVVCRARLGDDDENQFPESVERHAVATGQIPVLSGLLFLVLSTLYAGVLGAVYRYDAVYAFQRTIVQGRVAASAALARFVVGLQSVPVRQKRDLAGAAHERMSVRKRILVELKSTYAWVVGHLLDWRAEVICLTEGIRDVTEQEYGIDLSDARVIGMGVDVDRFAVDTDRDRATGPDDTWVVTYVGSIGEPRGLEHVLEAVAETDRDVEFHVAGGGRDRYMAELRELTRELGIEDRVEWLGIVSHEAVPSVIARSDLAISPLHDIESYRISFPAKILEYMAAGSLVVATDIPAHRRLVDDGRNGLLYDGSVDGLLDVFDACAEGDVDTRALRRAARDTAGAYDWDAVVAEHERVLFDQRVRQPRAAPVSA